MSDSSQSPSGDLHRINPAAKEALRELQGPGDGDLYEELIEIFYKTSDKFLLELRVASSPEQLNTLLLQETAHSWKSSAAVVGAEILNDLLRTLESDMRNKDVSNVATLVSNIEFEYGAVKSALSKK